MKIEVFLSLTISQLLTSIASHLQIYSLGNTHIYLPSKRHSSLLLQLHFLITLIANLYT